MSGTVELDLLRNQNAKLRDDLSKTTGSGGGADGGNNGPHLSQALERVSRLEGEFGSIKFACALVTTALVACIAFLGVQAIRLDNHVTGISDQVAVLPEKINANLRDLTRTLSEAITASKQTAPQVILLPAPVEPPPVAPTRP